MIEVKGDFWEYADEYEPCALVCTTNKVVKNNGELVMGAGIAKDFKERYPFLPKDWGSRLKKYPEHGLMITITPSMRQLVSFPTKHHWKDNSDLELILQSAKQLVQASILLGWESVLLTRPGCGCGGLKWEDVKPHLQIALWDDAFIVINNE